MVTVPPASVMAVAMARPIPPAHPSRRRRAPPRNPWTAAYGPSYHRIVVEDDGGDPELDALELDAFDRVTFSDEELTELALEAEPFDPFGPDVEPYRDLDPARFPLLPDWYMPAPGSTRSRKGGAVMWAFALDLVVINIGGFCVTWGVPEFVWKW